MTSSATIAEKYAHDLRKTISVHCDYGLYEALKLTRLGMSKLNHGAVAGAENLKEAKPYLSNFEKVVQDINKKLIARSASLGISLAEIFRNELAAQVSARISTERAVSTLSVLQEVGAFVEIILDALDYIEQMKLQVNADARARLSKEQGSVLADIHILTSRISIALQQCLEKIISECDDLTKSFIHKFIYEWIYAVQYRYDFSLEVLQAIGLTKKLKPQD